MAESALIKLIAPINKASINAINRATASTVTGISKFIRERYNINKRDLDRRISVSGRAAEGRMFGLIKVKRANVNLIYFGATQIGKGYYKSGVKRTQGVRATVIRGQRRLYRRQGGQAGAFITTVNTGRGTFTGVFARTGAARLPIEALFGVNLLQRLETKGSSKIREAAGKIFAENFEKRFVHEVKRAIG